MAIASGAGRAEIGSAQVSRWPEHLYVVRIVQGPRRVKTGNVDKINKLQKCLKNTIYFTLMLFFKNSRPAARTKQINLTI